VAPTVLHPTPDFGHPNFWHAFLLSDDRRLDDLLVLRKMSVHAYLSDFFSPTDLKIFVDRKKLQES
jgi:hypothetical protein